MRWFAALATLALLVGATAHAQAESNAAPQPAPEGTGTAQPAPTEITATPAEPTPAPTGEAAPETKPEAKPEATAEAKGESATDAPSDLERIIVAGAAGAVAVVGLGVGITFGVLALNDYNCLKDVVACNADRDDKIEGTKYLDARAEVERKALYADMGYLVAATAATVAIVGTVELLLGSGKESAE